MHLLEQWLVAKLAFFTCWPAHLQPANFPSEPLFESGKEDIVAGVKSSEYSRWGILVQFFQFISLSEMKVKEQFFACQMSALSFDLDVQSIE